MHSLNMMIMIVLAACMLPYVFTIIGRRAAGYNSKKHGNPRDFLNRTDGLAARANAVQQNSFEGLSLFIAAILIADYLVVKDFYIILLGMAYLFFRVLYGACYLLNLNALRSVFWVLSTLCPIILLVICIRL